MNKYICTYTIDGLRLTEKEPIFAESEEKAEELLRQKRGHKIRNIFIETINEEERR